MSAGAPQAGWFAATGNVDDALHAPNVAAISVAPSLQNTRFCGLDDTLAPCDAAVAGPCGVGFAPVEGGGCAKVGVPWSCPPGFLAATSSGPDLPDCSPDPKECGTSKFPPVPAAGVVKYVDASAAVGGDGSMLAPFATLAAALTKTGAADVVAIAAGTYEEVVSLDRSVALVGRCAAMVKLLAPKGANAAVFVKAKKSGQVVKLGVTGLQVGGGKLGIVAQAGSQVQLSKVWVHGAGGAGIGVFAGSLSATDVVVQDTASGVAGWRGEGIAVGFGGQAQLSRVRVSRSGFAGLWVQQPGSALVGEEVLVDATRSHGGFDKAFGLAMLDGEATLQGARLTGNGAFGVRLEGQAPKLKLTAAVVDANGRQLFVPPQSGGVGVNGGNAELRAVRLTGNKGLGMLIAGAKTTVLGRGLLVDGGLDAANPGNTAAIAVTGGAQAQLWGLGLLSGRHAALHAVAAKTVLDVRGAWIVGTRPHAASKQGGLAVLCTHGATLKVEDAALLDSRGAGALVHGEGSSIALQDVTVAGTRGGELAAALGAGLSVEGGGTLEAQALRVADNRGAGVNVSGKGSRALLRHFAIVRTQTAANGKGGGGLLVAAGGSVAAWRGTIRNNKQVSVVVREPGTSASLWGIAIDDTATDDAGLGIGAAALDGARLHLVGSQLRRNKVAGVWSLGVGGTETRLVGTVVDDTTPGSVVGRGGALQNLEGTGFTAFRAAQTVAIHSCVLARNHAAGIAFVESGGEVKHTVVVTTRAAKFEAEGGKGAVQLADAIVVNKGGTVKVAGCVLAAHQRAGVLADGGSNVKLIDSLAADGGFGVVSQGGATIEQKGSWLRDNDVPVGSDAGLFVPPPPKFSL